MAEAAISCIDVDDASARWRLKGVSRFSTERNKPLDSGSLLEVQGAKFGLRLQWGGADSDNGSEEVVALYAQLVQSSGTMPFWWRAQLRAINSMGQPVCGPHAPEWLDAKKSSDAKLWGHPKWWKRSDLLRSNCVVDDVLILMLRIEAWPSMPRTEYFPAVVGAPAEVPGAALAADLLELLRRGEGADVELRPGGEDPLAEQEQDSTSRQAPMIFRAHRAVLAARSPVFRQMFYSAGMREAAADAQVTLGDVEPKVAGWFLDFLYSDTIAEDVWEDDEAVCHLLAVAHEYDVTSLLRRCEARISSRLTAENAIERLMMADRLGIPGLRGTVLQYICCSRARLAKVQAGEAFGRLGKNFPHLLMEIVSTIIPPESKKRLHSSEGLPSDLETRTCAQLKQLCSDNGLHTSGTRDTLIQRLQQWAASSSSQA